MTLSSTSLPVGPINTLHLAGALEAAVVDRERDIEAGSVDPNPFDVVIESLLVTLGEFPSKRWYALSNGAGVSPILVAAATHCRGAALDEILELWRQCGAIVSPFSPPAIALSFGTASAFEAEWSVAPLSQIIRHGKDTAGIGFLLILLDRCPALDIAQESLASLPLKIVRLLAWFMARDGIPPDGDAALMNWYQRDEIELRFWSGLAMLLRYREAHSRRAVLRKHQEDDPIRQMVAEAADGALAAGPLSAEEAWMAFSLLKEGSRQHRLARAFRLAAFLPQSAPVVDPFIAASRQEVLAARLKQSLSAQ